VTSQGSLNIATDPFPLAATMVVMDFAVKWMWDVRQKKKGTQESYTMPNCARAIPLEYLLSENDFFYSHTA